MLPRLTRVDMLDIADIIMKLPVQKDMVEAILYGYICYFRYSWTI